MANGDEHVVFDTVWGRDAGDMWEHVTANCSPAQVDREIHFFFMSDVACIIDPDTRETLLEQQADPGVT
jgi:hypothetical protein